MLATSQQLGDGGCQSSVGPISPMGSTDEMLARNQQIVGRKDSPMPFTADFPIRVWNLSQGPNAGYGDLQSLGAHQYPYGTFVVIRVNDKQAGRHVYNLAVEYGRRM
jgi:hypothetical protein